MHAVILAILCGALPPPPTPAPAPARPLPELATLVAVRAAIQTPAAPAVLVNVWATWCDSCRDELPALLAFYKENRARGVRLVMVSADDEDQVAEVARVLDGALASAGIDAPTGIVSLVKHEDDTVFVNGMDKRWSGAIPATFLFNSRGVRKKSWLTPVTRDDLEAGARELLTAAPSEIRPKPKANPHRRTP